MVKIACSAMKEKLMERKEEKAKVGKAKARKAKAKAEAMVEARKEKAKVKVDLLAIVHQKRKIGGRRKRRETREKCR